MPSSHNLLKTSESQKNIENSSRNEDQLSHENYKEERRILLEGVADSLRDVVQKMAKANQNIHGIAQSSKEIEQVSEVWRDAFGRGQT